MISSESSSEYNVPGHNNATYGPIPKAEQVFQIEQFEVSPLPVPVDRTFFTLLRGYIRASKAKELGIDDAALRTATLTVTRSVIYSDGQRDDLGEFGTGTVPLFTAATRMVHFAIRNDAEEHVEYLTLGNPNSLNSNTIITDCMLLGDFIPAGTWYFEFVARIPDKNVCLFAFRFSQWLGHAERPPPRDHGKEKEGKEKVQ